MAIRKSGTTDASKSQADFARRMAGGSPAAVYLLEGREGFLREQAINQLIEAVADPGLREFNVSEISVSKGNLDEALAIASQYPMMSSRRVVVVRDFEGLNDESQIELLKDYFRRPVETTVLVFDSPGLDNRRNIATLLRKFAEVVTFEPLDERDAAPRWVMDYAARSGSSIDSGAAAYLVGMAGADLQRLSTEVDKLCLYAGTRGRISRDDVDLLVRHAHEHSNFELVDALVDGNRKRALTLLAYVFDATTDKQGLAVMILGAVGRAYRNLLISQEMMQQNANNSEIAKAVGMSPYGVGHLNERARKTSTAQILKAIARIAETDIALKTSKGTPRLQLEMLICELSPNRS